MVQKLIDKRLFEFIITNPNADKVGDVVPDAEIDEALDGWLLRGGSINDAHSNRVIGKALRFWVDANGNRIGKGIVYDDSQVADEVWNKILSGEYGSVSIGGAAFNKVPNEFGGKDLNDLEILEVSVCPKGMHQDANILEINHFAKEEYPFFFKGEISVEKFKKQLSTNNEQFVNVSASSQLDSSGAKKNEVGVMGKSFDDVKVLKPDMPAASPASAPVSRDEFDALVAQVQQLLGRMSAPAPMPNAGVEAYNKLEMVGVAAPSGAGGDGEDAILPKTVDDKRESQGKPSDVGNDDIKVMQKMLNSLISKMNSIESNVTKMNVGSSVTPTPMIEKINVSGDEDSPSWALIKGKKTLDDFSKNSRVNRLENEMSRIKAFEGYWDSQRGVAK